MFSSYLTNFQLFHQQGTNAFGGVLIVVHRSIPVQRVIKFDSICNLIVLDVGNSSRKFQLATYYSPPNENIPLNIFKEILSRNSDTIILGDLNAKHDSWSNTTNNQKGRLLYEYLNENDLQVVNKFVPTSTRSNAAIDLILAPASMLSDPCTVLPSIESDHYPIIWSSPFNIPSKDLVFPIKRTYWTLYELFITFTSSYWNSLFATMSDKIEFFSLCERFLSLSASRLTYVSYCNTYRPSIPPDVIELIQIKRRYLQLVRKTKHPYYILQLKLYSSYTRKVLFVYKKKECGLNIVGISTAAT
ncbi:unnamed protein product [Rotaria magnacalcarata]|uniref:Endonuclease/exonuclease/phosphatase domain-containing protein n=2 Tax=Rotaria magnacalcarata TaxID=392030 RepID=A0A816HFD0_9BILA|nr:unnamed protein product [Rotaria magnacalcarata]CAF1685342.1 unnamed protein product [Rotaria magnacalcarata]CAF1990982.1 unnamed protein product [Rotaria magnacalcarata]CAF3963950.1 unnamed protein product [Rotaria magnacalcarata]CAF3973999.1 unnamed protein product [Rotaria magnacalcarata]